MRLSIKLAISDNKFFSEMVEGTLTMKHVISLKVNISVLRNNQSFHLMLMKERSM